MRVILKHYIFRMHTKTLCELLCSNRLVTKLKLVEDSLKSETNTLLTIITLSRHFIDSFSQEICEVQHLLNDD